MLRPILTGSVFLALWARGYWRLPSVSVALNALTGAFPAVIFFTLRDLGGAMLLGAAAGSDDPWQPLSNFGFYKPVNYPVSTACNAFANVQQLQEQLKQTEQDNKWVLLDFTQTGVSHAK